MTKDNFIKSVNKYLEDYEKYWIDKDQIDIIHNAYSIAKTYFIVNYLIYIATCDSPDSLEYVDACAYKSLVYKIIPIMPDDFRIVDEIYEDEYNYDTPMWGTYDNLSTIIIDFTDDIIDKIQNKNN